MIQFRDHFFRARQFEHRVVVDRGPALVAFALGKLVSLFDLMVLMLVDLRESNVGVPTIHQVLLLLLGQLMLLGYFATLRGQLLAMSVSLGKRGLLGV